MNSVTDKRFKEEERQICLRGYTVRSFQEDNNHKASWAYTVGLTSELRPTCLFVRAGVEDNLLDSILCDIAEYVKANGIPKYEFTLPDFSLANKEKIRFKLRKVKIDIIDSLKDRFNNYVEGQTEDSNYYWVMIADANNKLPGEEGYIDFKQFNESSESTDPVGNELLIEDFDEKD